MVLATHRLLYERLVHDLTVDDDGIAVLAERDLGGHLESTQRYAYPPLHDSAELFVYFRAAVP